MKLGNPTAALLFSASTEAYRLGAKKKKTTQTPRGIVEGKHAIYSTQLPLTGREGGGVATIRTGLAYTRRQAARGTRVKEDFEEGRAKARGGGRADYNIFSKKTTMEGLKKQAGGQAGVWRAIGHFWRLPFYSRQRMRFGTTA